MVDIRDRLLRAHPAGDELYGLWREYEEGRTPEARLMKQFDKLEMLLQAFEYEQGTLICVLVAALTGVTAQGKDLDEFFTSTPLSLFTDPQFREIASELLQQREQARAKKI